MKRFYRIAIDHWYIERAVYLIGGFFVVGTTILGLLVHPYWHYVTLFVGMMFVNFALSGYCPLALILHAIGMRKR